MADWQGELEALLARLSVSLEDGERLEASEPPSESSVGADTSVLDGPESDPLWVSVSLAGEELKDNVEVSAVRSEIEATLHQIIALARRGRIEPALRDDVVFVLRALTRPRPPANAFRLAGQTQGGETQDSAQEWQLASAAAVLRFCRIVSRLTNTLVRDSGV